MINITEKIEEVQKAVDLYNESVKLFYDMKSQFGRIRQEFKNAYENCENLATRAGDIFRETTEKNYEFGEHTIKIVSPVKASEIAVRHDFQDTLYADYSPIDITIAGQDVSGETIRVHPGRRGCEFFRQ